MLASYVGRLFRAGRSSVKLRLVGWLGTAGLGP